MGAALDIGLPVSSKYAAFSLSPMGTTLSASANDTSPTDDELVSTALPLETCVQ